MLSKTARVNRRVHARRVASTEEFRSIAVRSSLVKSSTQRHKRRGKGIHTGKARDRRVGGRLSMRVTRRDEGARGRTRERGGVTYMEIIAKYTRGGFFWSNDRRLDVAFRFLQIGVRFYNVHVNICCSLRSEARRRRGEAEVRKKEACVSTFVQSVPLNYATSCMPGVGATTEPWSGALRSFDRPAPIRPTWPPPQTTAGSDARRRRETSRRPHETPFLPSDLLRNAGIDCARDRFNEIQRKNIHPISFK